MQYLGHLDVYPERGYWTLTPPSLLLLPGHDERIDVLLPECTVVHQRLNEIRPFNWIEASKTMSRTHNLFTLGLLS